VDYKTVKPAAIIPELGDFLLRELQLPPMEVVNFYVDHALQQLLVTMEADKDFNAAVDRLNAGVPWVTAAGGITHG
jgi:hypothetical protein